LAEVPRRNQILDRAGEVALLEINPESKLPANSGRRCIMENLHWWEFCYVEAVIETDQNLKLLRIDEANEAIKQRLLRPIRPGSAEDTRIKLAQESLALLKTELLQGIQERQAVRSN
jgi:hypothetical protein